MSNTLWSPHLPDDGAPIYRAIADALERDVENGLLRDGSRLPTHRQLAERLGVTPLTITRAYKEAARRGLIDATIGRGTFVRAPGLDPDDYAPGTDFLDLSRNIIAGSDAIDLDLRAFNALRHVMRDSTYQATGGMLRHRMAAAAWIKRAGLPTTPERIVITPGAQQAIVAVLASLCRPGDTVLAEEWTYPRFGAMTGLLHLRVQSVALDEHGLIPRSLEKACRRSNPKALYLIPNFQNPTGSVMPEKRRRDIVAVARRHSLPIIEDDVYGFLLPSPPVPIATLAPELTSYVTSTSKSVTPSLRLGFASMPEALVERVTSACGALTAFTSSASAELFTQLLESGGADRVVEGKRKIVAVNRRAAARAFGESELAGHAMSPHLWVQMVAGIDARDIADRARQRGIGIAPAPAFAVDRVARAEAVRISVGATSDTKQLEMALRTLASLMTNQRLATGTIV
jgi:DNA-binding transcriptional MocR family regulator